MCKAIVNWNIGVHVNQVKAELKHEEEVIQNIDEDSGDSFTSEDESEEEVVAGMLFYYVSSYQIVCSLRGPELSLWVFYYFSTFAAAGFTSWKMNECYESIS